LDFLIFLLPKSRFEQRACKNLAGQIWISNRANSQAVGHERKRAALKNIPAGAHSCNPTTQVSIWIFSFLPGMAEGNVKAQKIYIRRDGKIVAFAMRDLTPLFEKGFRFGLWFKHEVPFLYLNESVPLCDVLWRAVLVAAVGIICCYKPTEGSSS